MSARHRPRPWRRLALAAVGLAVATGSPTPTPVSQAAPAPVGAPSAPAPAAAAEVPAADLLDADFAGGTATDHAQGLPATTWGTPTYATDPELGDILRVTSPESAPTLADDAVSFDWAGQWSKITTGFAIECVFRIDMTTPVGSEKDLCSSKEGGGFSVYVTGGNLGTMAHIGGGYKSVLTPIDGHAWHHALSVWDGNSLTLYVDGAPVGSTPAAGTFLAPPNAATHRFVVGGDAAPSGVGQWAPPSSYAGTKVWSHPLDAAQARAAAAAYGFVTTVPEADVLDVDFSDGTPVDRAQNLALKTWGAPVITHDSALGRNVAVFDGVDDAYGYRFHEQWDKLAGGYAIECTFKFNGTLPVGQEEDICSSKESGGTTISIYGDQLTFNPYTGGAYRGAGTTMQAGRWYHAIGTWDGANARLYVNGLLAATTAAPGALGKPSATATQWVLGADAANNAGAQFYAPTTIAASRVYDEALDVAEIGALYAEELGGVPGSQVALNSTAPAEGDHLDAPVTFEADITNEVNATGWSYLLDGRPIAPGQEIGGGLAAGDHRIVITATGVFGEPYRWEVSFTSAAIPTDGGTDADQGEGSVALSAIAHSPDGGEVTTTFREATATPAGGGFQGVVAAMPTTLEFDYTEQAQIAGRQLPDGERVSSASTRNIPFQRYDVAVTSAEEQRIVWSGIADPARAVSLHAWNTATQRWVEVATSRGAADRDTVLSGRIRPELVDNGVVHVLVTGVDPFADDLAPRDESAQDDKDRFEDPADYDFSFAHFTDTQYLAEGAAGGTYDDFDGNAEPTDVMQEEERAIWEAAYDASTEWITDNAGPRKIAYTAHTGDVIENDYNDPLATNASGGLLWPGLEEQVTREFQVTQESHDTMDQAGIVNQVIAGNHDNQLGNETGPTSRFNQYYGPQRYYEASERWPAGASYHAWDESSETAKDGRDNQNNYVLFSAGGLDFVAVGLSYGVTQAEADWASSVFARYPDRNGILITHAYIAPSTAPDGRGAGFSADGSRLFEEVVASNPNVFLVLAGHEHGVGTNLKTGVGVTVEHEVVELLADYQFYKVSAAELWPEQIDPNGNIDVNGDGTVDHRSTDLLQFGASFLRLLQFDVERSEMSIDTYSPFLDNFGATEYDDRRRYNGAEDNLVIPVDLETRTTSFETDALTVITPTDTVIGEATARSGWPATVRWTGLSEGEVYAWVADSRSSSGEVVRGLRQYGGVFVATAAGTDTVAPVLTLPATDVVVRGEVFDPLAGVSATDDTDGDVTGRIEVLGLVDTDDPGSYALTYVVSDSAGNQTVVPRAVRVVEPTDDRATVTVTAGNVRGAFGTAVPLQAQVGPAVATGTVQFLNGEEILCEAPVAGGTASCAPAMLPAPGDYVVTAIYSGDQAYAPAQRTFVLTVTQPTTQPTPQPPVAIDPQLDASATKVRVGKKGKKKVVLSAALVAGATGQVTFSVGTSGGRTLCVATIQGGTATCRPSGKLRPGKHTVVAIYPGDGQHRADSDTFTLRQTAARSAGRR